MPTSPTRFARTPDGFAIAYREWGDKDPVHIYLSEFGASCDTRDVHPSLIRHWRNLSAISRVVNIDRRGIGSSDIVTPYRFDRIDEFVADVLAVVDALGAEKIVLTGEGSSAGAAILFAVTYPERVERLALLNCGASSINRDDYDISPLNREDVLALADHWEATWGEGGVFAMFSPGLVTDPSFVEVCGRIERLTCGPTAAGAWVRAIVDFDLRELAPQVTVPTLVYYSGDLLHTTVEQARDLADRIPGAQFVDAQGKLFYVPDDSPQLDAYAEFLGGHVAPDPTEQVTLLFTDVVGSTDHAGAIGDAHWTKILDDLDAWVDREVAQHGGRIVKHTGDGHLATFSHAEGALAAGLSIARSVHALGVEVRCGVHSGDVVLRTSGDIGGLSVHFAARVMSKAGPRQLLASDAVTRLAPTRSYESRGTHDLKGFDGSFELFEVMS